MIRSFLCSFNELLKVWTALPLERPGDDVISLWALFQLLRPVEAHCWMHFRATTFFDIMEKWKGIRRDNRGSSVELHRAGAASWHVQAPEDKTRSSVQLYADTNSHVRRGGLWSSLSCCRFVWSNSPCVSVQHSRGNEFNPHIHREGFDPVFTPNTRSAVCLWIPSVARNTGMLSCRKQSTQLAEVGCLWSVSSAGADFNCCLAESV